MWKKCGEKRVVHTLSDGIRRENGKKKRTEEKLYTKILTVWIK